MATTKRKEPGIRRVGRRWEARVKLVNPRTGLMEQRRRLVDSREEARAVRDQMRREIQGGGKAARVRVDAFVSSWLTGKLPSLKPSTRKHYAEVLDLFVADLGDVYMDALGFDDLVQWRSRLKGRPATVNTRMRPVKTMLRDAVRMRVIPFSPAEALTAVREGPKRKRSVTGPELFQVLEGIRTMRPRWYPLFATLAYTGLRFGEATALKWSDVDVQAGVIHVVRSQWRGQVDGQRREPG